MRRALLSALMLALALSASPVSAAGGVVLYVDDDVVCAGNMPCYPHPQDAVNAAPPGAAIRVYPGHYGSRSYGPACGDHAPALIVFKDDLDIGADDANPANTVIEAAFNCWSNPSAVRAATNGGVNPTVGSEPNAVSIIASGVTLRGFTLLRPYSAAAGGHSTVLVGGLYQGYGMHGEALGYGSNTISGCVMGGGPAQNVNGAVIWHSAGNSIAGNTIFDPQWAAISIYDGNSDAQVALPSPGTGNKVFDNRITDDPVTVSLGQAVFVGAWNSEGPTGIWTDNDGTRVYRNDCGGMGLYTAYSSGSKKFYNNTGVGWADYYNASDFAFNGNKEPRALVAPGMHGLQVGPPR